MNDRLKSLLGSKVEVRAGGVVYRGVLVEASESEIVLKGETSWVTVPMSRVTSVKREGESEGILDRDRVDPSFFSELYDEKD